MGRGSGRSAAGPHPGVHHGLEQMARMRGMAAEPARFLTEYEVDPLGFDGRPDLVDAWPVGDLAADLGLPVSRRKMPSIRLRPLSRRRVTPATVEAAAVASHNRLLPLPPSKPASPALERG